MLGDQAGQGLDQAGSVVAESSAAERAEFITKTYAHLAGAVGAFALLLFALVNTPGIENLIGAMFGTRFSWLLVLGAFMLVSTVANRWAVSATSLSTQYLGLGLYVVAEAIIMLPLVYIAAKFGGPNVLPIAATGTLTVFGGLTAIVFVSKADFSFDFEAGTATCPSGATVAISRAINDISGQTQKQAYAQLAFTTFDFTTVGQVRFQVEGKNVDAPTDNGNKAVVTAEDYPALRPGLPE